MKYITIIVAFTRLITICMLLLLINGQQDYYFVWGIQIFCAAFSSFMSIYIALTKLRIFPCWPGWLHVFNQFKSGWSVFISSFMSIVMTVSGVFFLGLFHGNEVVGYYSAIDKVAKACNSMLTPITQAAFPHISSEFKTSYTSGIAAIKQVGKVIIFCAAIVSVTMVFGADIIVSILFGDSYLPYSNILVILTIWFLAGLVNNVLGIQYMIGSGNERYYGRSFIIASTISIIVYLATIQWLSYYGVALGMIIAELSLTTLLLYYASRIHFAIHRTKVI